MQLLCPFCGTEHTDYFANVEREDWTILQPSKCVDGVIGDDQLCRGCVEIAEVESELECPNCEEVFEFYARVETHCKDGETVLELRVINRGAD
mgnify:CR=1 FL=1